MTQPATLVVPPGVLTPGAPPALELLARLHSLECQALALEVLAWFDARPQWNTPFRLDIGYLDPDELSAVLRFSISPVPPASTSSARLDQAKVRVERRNQLLGLQQVVSSRLEPTIGAFAIELSQHLNAVNWDAVHVHRITTALLQRHASVDPAAFLAQVDPAAPSGLAARPSGPPPHDGATLVLPALLPSIEAYDLNEERYQVSRLVQQHVALEVEHWFRAHLDWAIPLVMKEVRADGAAPRYEILPDEDDRVLSPEEVAIVRPLQDLFNRLRAPDSSAWVSSFVSTVRLTLNKVQWRPADYEWPLTAALSAGGLDPDLLVQDRRLRDLAALEAQVMPAPDATRPRM